MGFETPFRGRQGLADTEGTALSAGDSPALPRVAGWLAMLAGLALLVLVPAATFWAVRAGALEDLRNEGLAAAQSRALTL